MGSREDRVLVAGPSFIETAGMSDVRIMSGSLRLDDGGPGSTFSCISPGVPV